MKRILKTLLFCALLSFILVTNVKADTLEDLSRASGAYSLGESLPEEAKKALSDIGVDSTDFSSISRLSIEDIFKFLGSTISIEASKVFPSVCSVLAIILLYSVFSGLFDGVSNPALSSVLSVVSALCIACVLLLPVCGLIEAASKAISISANFMLAYIPVMGAVLISAGQTVTGSGYSTMMVVASEAVGQFFSKIISPLLSGFLTLGVSSSVVAEIKLISLINSFSKTVKWLMSFVFTLFTGFLSLKTLFSASVDNVSSRAVRYTMSSFIPVVGGALSEAYRTVHGSVGVLKSGIGVFVIIAVITVFAPVLVKLCIWLITVSICKGFSETADLSSPVQMLSAVSTVLSLLLSVILCIIALFVITTALIISVGGA